MGAITPDTYSIVPKLDGAILWLNKYCNKPLSAILKLICKRWSTRRIHRASKRPPAGENRFHQQRSYDMSEPVRQFEVTSVSVTLSNDKTQAHVSFASDGKDAFLLTMKRSVLGSLRSEIDRAYGGFLLPSGQRSRPRRRLTTRRPPALVRCEAIWGNIKWIEVTGSALRGL